MSQDADAVAREAVRAVLGGDHNAFSRVVELYQRRLFGLALMITRDASGAEEVAQDAFVRAFVHLDAYDEGHPFYPWLSTITVRLAQNWIVKRARVTRREGTDLVQHTGAAAPGSDPLAALIADEEERGLWRSVAALPSGERTAAILYYRDEFSVRQVASALGVTTGTVKTLLFRVRRRLRQSLAARLAKDSK